VTVRLVACPKCHTQYDVTGVEAPVIPCRCGEAVETRERPGVDLPVQRCSSCGAIAREDARSCEYCGAEIAWSGGTGDLVCPECYARNATDARFCVACGVRFEPQPVATTCETVDCIRCGIPMPGRALAGVLVHECPRCSSLWVPGNRFDALVERAAASPRAVTPAGADAAPPRVQGGNPLAESVQYRRCPACKQLMTRRNFRRVSGVVIDRCAEHGTWLDADELEEIAGFVASGGLARAAEHEAKEAARHRAAASPADRTDTTLHRVLTEDPATGDAWERLSKLMGLLMTRPRRLP
jgi:Zn-finger nucleic acid-binding protein